MRTQEARDSLKNIKTPAFEVRASFDEILLQLKPEIFLKLCMISHLLLTEAKPE